jgi:hypothetical protein
MKINYGIRFIERCKIIHHNYYEYKNVNYENAKTPVEIICPIHGIFMQTPSDHLYGKCGCPNCKFDKIGNIKRINFNDTILLLHEIHGDKYDYSKVNYVNNKSKVTIICKEHGEFLLSINKHKMGRGCPQCSKRISSGELKIKKFLDYVEIGYVRQKWFDDLRVGNRVLYYDFFLPSYNLLIEFDGEFHFDPNKQFNKNELDEYEATDKYWKTREYDSRKNTYAFKHNLALLRISYKENDYNKICKIIAERLNSLIMLNYYKQYQNQYFKEKMRKILWKN